jgi:hypothetical protein
MNALQHILRGVSGAGFGLWCALAVAFMIVVVFVRPENLRRGKGQVFAVAIMLYMALLVTGVISLVLYAITTPWIFYVFGAIVAFVFGPKALVWLLDWPDRRKRKWMKHHARR